MVDMDEMMDKIDNINSRVEKLYSKEFHECEPVGTLEGKEAVNSIYGLKSCIAQQAKEITELTRQVDNQKDTIKNMSDNLIAIAKERDNLTASLEAEKEHAKACNNNFYEYRLSTAATTKGYQQELERVRSERDTIKALNEQLNADFGVLAKNHKALGEQYSDLKNQICRELESKEEQIKLLKLDIKESKIRYVNKTIEFNRLNGEHLDLKREYDNLVIGANKYSWKRVDRSEPLPLEDHQLYLFAIDGYPTPVKGKFHDDSLSNITIIVDDGKGKGPEQKVLFFMDGHIRYWTPLPEMPDMPKGVDDYD